MSASFNYNKKQIIIKALRDLNVISDRQEPSPEQYKYCSDTLNLMIKMWQGDPEINLWKRRQGYLFLDLNTAEYQLGQAGANATNSYKSTTITGGNLSAISVTSAAGMSNGDNIGIQLDSGTRFWTTINGAPSGTTITLTDNLPSTASNGNFVIAYTTKLNRPLRILRATILDLTNNSEALMMDLGYDEYFDLPIKSIQGRPNNWFYDRQITGNNPYTGQIYVYPVPNRVSYILTFSYQEPLYDIINSSDYPDFPVEWELPIVQNLSCAIAGYYGKWQEKQNILPEAVANLQKLKAFDGDDSTIRFTFL